MVGQLKDKEEQSEEAETEEAETEMGLYTGVQSTVLGRSEGDMEVR